MLFLTLIYVGERRIRSDFYNIDCNSSVVTGAPKTITGLIVGLCTTNERRHANVSI